MNLINKNDSIFVAGHKGMAGSAICNSLKKNGYKNLLLIDRSELDLLDYKEVNKWFAKNKPEVVIIAAAKVGGIEANSKYPVEFLLENLKIQNNIIENSWKNCVKRLLFLGSSCIYPKNSPQPINEESLLTSPLETTNESYALAKITGIKLCQALRAQYGFDAISLMPTNLYGPGDNYHLNDSHVLPALIRKFYEAKENKAKEVICWGSGKPLREFLHSDDLGEATVFALEKWSPSLSNAPLDKNGVPLNFLNVGTGKDISIKLLAEEIANIVNFDGEILWDESKPDGTLKKQLNVQRLKNLGWGPKISLKDGLRSTIKTFESNLIFGNLRL